MTERVERVNEALEKVRTHLQPSVDRTYNRLRGRRKKGA